MFDPNDLENFETYCDRILEQISRDELLHKAGKIKPGIRMQLFASAGDVMIRFGTYLKTQAGHDRPAQPSIYIQT